MRFIPRRLALVPVLERVVARAAAPVRFSASVPVLVEKTPELIFPEKQWARQLPIFAVAAGVQEDFHFLLMRLTKVVGAKAGASLQKLGTALSWFYDRKFKSSELDHETIVYYKLLARFALLAAERHSLKAEAKATKLVVPEEPIGIIYTRHPSCPDYESYPIEGRLSDLLDRDRADPELALEIDVELKTLLEMNHHIPALTLYREIKINHGLIENILQALAELEVDHSLKAGSLLRQRNWTGTEADRNANTRLVTLLTKLLDLQAAIKIYAEQLQKIKDIGEEASAEELEKMNAYLLQVSVEISPVWRLVKTYAAWETINKDPKKYKFARDNMEQFFAEKKEDPLSYYLESLTRLALPGGKLSFLEETEKRLRKAFKSTADTAHLEALAQGILDKAISSAAKRESAILKHKIINAGFHLSGGQSRLDSKEAILHAAEALLEAEKIKRVPTHSEAEHLVAVLECGEIEPLSLESLLSLEGEAQETIGHFRSIELLNVNPRMIPDLVLANFSHVEDFLRAFYLAVKTGLIKIEKGKVVSSKLLIIPLFESVDDHRAAGKVLDALFAIPLMRSYFLCTKEVRLMSAYSDTPREDGKKPAIVAISFAGRDMHQAYQKHFSGTAVRYARQHGTGSSFRRSGHAVGSDRDRRARLLASDTVGHLRTWQSGELDYKASTVARSKLSLLEALHMSQASGEASDRMGEELANDELRAFLESLFEPGREAFKKMVGAKDGAFNQLLLELPGTWTALLETAMGSRKKAKRDPRLDKKSIIYGERKITVTQVLEAMGFDPHIIIIFYVSMQRYLGPVSDINPERLKSLQAYYEKYQLVRDLFNASEEGIFQSFSDVLERHREHSRYPDLIDRLIHKLHESEAYLLLISKQAKIFDNRPGIGPVFHHMKEQNRFVSELGVALNALDNPLSRSSGSASNKQAFFARQVLMGANVLAGRASYSTEASSVPRALK